MKLKIIILLLLTLLTMFGANACDEGEHPSPEDDPPSQQTPTYRDPTHMTGTY